MLKDRREKKREKKAVCLFDLCNVGTLFCVPRLRQSNKSVKRQSDAKIKKNAKPVICIIRTQTIQNDDYAQKPLINGQKNSNYFDIKNNNLV